MLICRMMSAKGKVCAVQIVLCIFVPERTFVCCMFHSIKVAELKKETEDCVSILLDIPAEKSAVFAYAPGQYLTFRAQIGGQEVRRSYSLCSAPSSGQWRVAVKRVPEGRFSGYVHEQLQVGDELEVMEPMGSFVPRIHDSEPCRYVCFAAGSGITPMMSIIADALQKDKDAEIDLFYGSKKTDSIIFKEELEALKNTHLHRFQLHYVLSRERLQSEWFYGRIDGEKCAHYGKYLFDPRSVTQYFLCGPESMIKAVESSLVSLGVPSDKISYELFTVPGAVQSTQERAEQRQSLGQTESMVTITLDGLDMTFIMDESDDNILDAALHQGADLPYACKGGVCSTCKAKVKKGEAAMAVNYALEPDEVDAGYVLTCQAVPTDSTVALSFDE